MCNIVTHLFPFIRFSPFSDESYPLFSLFPSYFSIYHIQGFCPCNFLYRFSLAYPSSVLYLVFLTASLSLLCQQFLRQLESRTNMINTSVLYCSAVYNFPINTHYYHISPIAIRRTCIKFYPALTARILPYS